MAQDYARAHIAQEWSRRREQIEQLPLPRDLGELVDQAAAEFGDRVAWDFFQLGERMTFTEVGARVRKAANALAEAGVTRGDTIAVAMENRPDFLATWLGAARLGACFVPINTRYTRREFDHIVGLAKPKLLLVDDAFLPTLVAAENSGEEHRPLPPTLAYNAGDDHWRARIDRASETHDADAMAHDEIVSIQFTSGTTGFPKGCLLPQRYWIGGAVSWAGYVDFPIQRTLCNQMLFYVDGQFNAISSLYRGATFFCCSKPSAARFAEWLREFRIESAFYFDPLFKQAPQRSDALTDLRLLHTFGLNPRIHSAVEDRYGAIVRDSYGMSECAPILMMPIDASALVDSGSCGLPAPHVRVRIVDELGRDVERGEVGELIAQSPGMLRGYVDDPDATARTIVDGWLHTGDLARQDADGFFYIVGRLKDMIRRNSENIAAVEVESVLRAMPQIAEAAVVGVPDDDVGEEVRAYVQLVDGSGSVDPEEILEFCRARLAKFKLPRYIVFVQDFPMTESSRVAKKALVGLDYERGPESFDLAQPRKPMRPASIGDFPGVVGETYVGDWFRIDAQRQDGFYRGTYLDLRYGESMTDIYPEGLVEGFHQLALLDHLSAELVGGWHGYNYGLDRVRFPSPLTVHDDTRLRLTVADCTPRDGGFLVRYDARLEVRGREKPSMIAEWLVLLLPEDDVNARTLADAGRRAS